MADQFGLRPEALAKIKAVFARHTEIKNVYLYGSRAKGNFQAGSDIDLAISAPSMSLSELMAIEIELDDLLLPYKIDICLIHQIDNPSLLDHIQRVGIKLLDSSSWKM